MGSLIFYVRWQDFKMCVSDKWLPLKVKQWGASAPPQLCLKASVHFHIFQCTLMWIPTGTPLGFELPCQTPATWYQSVISRLFNEWARGFCPELPAASPLSLFIVYVQTWYNGGALFPTRAVVLLRGKPLRCCVQPSMKKKKFNFASYTIVATGKLQTRRVRSGWASSGSSANPSAEDNNRLATMQV